MIKILTAAQIKDCDQFTIANEPVSSLQLMERASRAFVSWFTSRFDVTKKIGIICGTGNNGGDGLAIARLLQGWSYPVKVWIVRGGVKETPDFTENLLLLRGKGDIFEITSAADQGLFHDRDVLIDAIFGSGISRPPEGIYAQAIRCINATDTIRVAVDVPSGLVPDSPSSGDIVKAHFTVSFQLPKLAFLFPENSGFVGDWKLVDIGLSKKYLKDAESSYAYTTEKSIRKKIKVRSKFSHKGDYGKALLIAGSYGKIGACILAARAALRSGPGLLTVHVPSSGYEIIQTTIPEAMVTVDSDARILTDAGALESFTVIGIGPGIGKDPKTVLSLEKVLKRGKPMVIDADALNILSANRHLLKLIPAGSILTPHPKEFQRLVGEWKNDFDRLENQKRLAKEINAVIVLKGANTSVAMPDGKVFFNSTGNPGMATGGSGDVLTGILTGLLAQGYGAEEAAAIGVYLHGRAGDLAALEKGMNSLIASDIIDYLPQAFKKTVG